MTLKFETRIISFEELPDRDGRLYTVYNIRVQAIHENIPSSSPISPSTVGKQSSVTNSWTLRKRYKYDLHNLFLFVPLTYLPLPFLCSVISRHFSHLYRSLKDRYPQIGQYKFPNKSVFHTFSQFTKERRRSGFEEFLNLVMSIRPLPPEMEDFLEVDDHHLPTDGNSSSSPIPYPESSIRQKKSTPHDKVKSQKETVINNPSSDNILPSSSTSLISKEDKIRENIKKKMFFVVMSSYIATTLFYALLIYTSFVDITSTTTGSSLFSYFVPYFLFPFADRIVLTMLSLGATVSLVRLSKMKRGVKN